MTQNTYTAKVGKGHPSERLEILNECYNPFSLKFLQDIDLEGKLVLEVACGAGIFTCELARLVGENGKVIATDISHEQLEVAKEYAEKQKLDNIAFLKCSALELEKLNIKFDCIFSRFLLVHLADPITVLKQELNCLKPEGYLICSEPPFAYNPMNCYPKSKVFDQIKEIHQAQVRIHNTDFSIGLKLPAILKELGCSLVYSYIGQPVLDTSRKKSQLRLGMHEISDHLVAKGFFKKAEIDQLSRELEQFEKENHVVVFLSTMETCVKNKR